MRNLLLFAVSMVAVNAADLPIMPLPFQSQPGTGAVLIDGSFAVAMSGNCGAQGEAAASRMLARLPLLTGISVSPKPAAKPPAAMVIHCDAPDAPIPMLGADESYVLTVSAEGIRLLAPRAVGAMRGMETFMQLIQVTPKGFAVGFVTINDRPRFQWRGLMLDSARHFFPVAGVLRTLDGMAAVKLNVLHWHLSDDQGFRVESKLYPVLTEKGSDGQFYTQQEIKDVIAYAAARGIRVVPEFDIPGHSTALAAAMPQLLSGRGPYQIERKIGIFHPTLDPTREEVYTFLGGFLGEMAVLFPDPFFHIGGDEVEPTEWNNNPAIQDYIKKKGLTNNEGLHAEFNKRLLEILAKNGKTVVGWDEVLSPNVPKQLVIESWRGPKGLAQAATQGHRVVLANGYYLDLNYPASQHYLVDPFDGDAAKLTPEQAQKILGGEACMWSEWISPENLDIRLWPRLAAVAERLWSPREARDLPSLYRRLENVTLYLDLLGMELKTNQSRMLKRMAGTEHVSALSALAYLVEPPQGYTRGTYREYKVTHPLNRLVDAVSPESLPARQFVTAASSGAPDAGLKAQLAAWRDNDAKLQPLLQRSYLLQEVVPLSQGLNQVAELGLEAIGVVEAGRKESAEWRKAKLDALASAGMLTPTPQEVASCRERLTAEHELSAAAIEKRCTQTRPAADLFIGIKPGVQKLIEKASQ